MKPTVKKCECGRVSNPLTLSIVSDAWVKKGVAYFDFYCPQCKERNTVSMIWDQRPDYRYVNMGVGKSNFSG